MNNNIEALERRYQALVTDYQAGRFDESAFVSEVDALQFQDDWGRYWMIGTQSGSWHYYDGQAWHQADPRDADKLPFMDEQGVYWQRGVKSGDWYYYQPDTGEWIKPSREDRVAPPTPRRDTMPTSSPVTQPSATAPGGAVPYNPQPHLRSASSGPPAPAQSDGELFQDDEGRYWSIGAKTGQWYFYDLDGWHPAHEFQPTEFGSVPQPQAYVPPAPAYYPPQVPYQPAYDPYQQPAYYPPPAPQPGPAYPPASQQPMPQPAQSYAAPPVVDQPPAQAQPVASPPGADPRPNPPTSRSKSGSWYFFDGDQWLKYSKEDDPEAEPPPEVVKEMTQEREEKPAAKAAPKPKKREEKKEEPVEEPVVAELFEEENEPPPEIVDVEIVTVIEAEPDLDDEPEPIQPFREPVRRATAAYAQPPFEDEVRPRRVNRTQTRPGAREATVPIEPQRQPKPRTASDPGRPVAPRKRESAQEPAILVPTESTASNIGSRSVSRPVRPSPSTTQQRRARENTMPMEPVAPTSPVGAASAAGAAARRPEGATQPMTSPARVDRAQARTAQLDTKPVKSVAPAPSLIKTDQSEKTGYTFGDVLRSFPSTIWTFVGGMAVLLIFALVIVGFRIVGSQSSDSQSGGLAAVTGATPTLVGAVANETPTTVPTATPALAELTTPEPAVLTIFTSPDLDLTLEYPENWKKDDDATRVIFSPSSAGLEPTDLKDSAFWVEKSNEEDIAISDLLAAILANFPTDVETLNKGTISIASQTWTSVQVRFDDEDLGGQGIATLAVTTKDGVGYTLVAMSPASLWSTLRPTFQEMINSFRFGVEDTPVASTGGGATARGTGTPATASQTEGDEAGTNSTPVATRTTPAATPTPIVDATPVVHTVKAGDTLGAIAVQYGVDIDLLAEENGITDPGSLSLDQELIIPFTAEELAAYRAGRDPAEVSGTGNASEDAVTDSATANGKATPANTEGSGNDNAKSGASGSSNSTTEAAELGGRIVYPAYNPSINSYDVWMYNIGTGEQTIIAGNSSQPAFNRDGSLLAYRSWDRATRGIFFRDFVGGRGGQVTGFVEDGLPTWAPDGYSFTFASRREGDRVPRIFRGNQTGKGDTGIGFIGEYVSSYPDGRLVVKGCSPAGDCGLYVMGPEGGNATKISSESSDTAPSVSPDGNRIAFMSAARGATNWEIWVMNADGSNAKRLTENGSNEGLPTWSPDGKSIAFVSDQGGVWAIWAMNADGTNQRKLVNMSGSPDGQVLQDTDNSKGWVEERISWAP